MPSLEKTKGLLICATPFSVACMPSLSISTSQAPLKRSSPISIVARVAGSSAAKETGTVFPSFLALATAGLVLL
jgi:hypothetical protein